MISKGLQQTIVEWYALKTYEDTYKNLHRDIQADIDHYFDASGEYGQVLSSNDWGALCKEWAKDKGFFINSSFGKYEDGIKCFATFEYKSYQVPSSIVLEDWFKAETEPEAIFSACEWILKETK